MTRIFYISLLVASISSSVNAMTQRIVFSADVVASTCHVNVEADSKDNNRLTFSTYRKSSSMTVPSKDFTINLYESGATVQGCSAFQAGKVSTLSFGNEGQLDSAGVITTGAGDGVHINVQSIDTQADYKGTLTAGASSVNYPIDFAIKGQFRFRAQPVIPVDVRAGEYTGALSFVVTYQ